MSLRIIILLSLMTCPVFGQADIRYDVQDQIKNDKIDYTLERDCVVYSWNVPPDLPNLQYHVSTSIWGCALKSFTYEDQDYNEPFAMKEYNELARIVKKVNLHKLQKMNSTSCLDGSLAIDGIYHYFNNPLGDPERDRLHEAVLSFLDKVIPRSKRTFTVHTFEGDFEPSRRVTIKELLITPARYDGKRVCVTGYYHQEDYESSFSQQ
jgi:hypothetical protein